MSNASPHITIIGAGITGAAAAYRLSQLGVAADVYEADPNVGGRWLGLSWVEPSLITVHNSSLLEETNFELWLKLPKLKVLPESGHMGSGKPRMVMRDGEVFLI